MKQKPSLYTIVITIACIVLSGLLYRAYHKTGIAQVSAAPIISATTPAKASAPAQTPRSTPAPWMLESSYYLPFGELPLQVLQQYAQYDASQPRHSLRQRNPIDTTFAPYWETSKGTMEENALAADYRECWKAEALHALDLLAKTHNPAAERALDIPPGTADMLLEFSDITGQLYADTFRDGGSAYAGAQLSAKAAFLRSYTCYLYDLLDFMGVQPDFVFQAKDVQDEWGYLLGK